MMSDSINLYGSYQYLNIRCYGCGSKNHIALTCPVIHGKFNKQQVISNYLQEQYEFQRNFKRSTKRRRFHAMRDMDLLQEAVSQIQINLQNELNFDEEEQLNMLDEYYSETDEILDNNIYDPQPIIYYDESGVERYFDPDNNKYWQKKLYRKPTLSKGDKRKADAIDLFIQKNYDPYYKSVNIDKVHNFEVYYPINNITKLITEFERIRMEKILQNRVGLKARHIMPLLIKGFKMNEKKQTRENSKTSLSKPKVPSGVMIGLGRKSSVRFRQQLDAIRNNGVPRSTTAPRRSEVFGRMSPMLSPTGHEATKRQGSLPVFEGRKDSLVVPERGRRSSLYSNGSGGINRKVRQYGERSESISSSSSSDSEISSFSRTPSNLPLERGGSFMAEEDPNKFKIPASPIVRQTRAQRLQEELREEKLGMKRLNSLKGAGSIYNSNNQLSHMGSLGSTKDVRDGNGIMGEEGTRVQMNFDYADNLMKFTKKLGENKMASPQGSSLPSLQQSILERTRSKVIKDPRTFIYAEVDLTRKILREQAKKGTTRLQRANSCDRHGEIKKTLEKLDIDNILKTYKPPSRNTE